MPRLAALILFCSLYILASAEDYGTDCIFDWEYFEGQAGSDSIVIDYSGQHIATLEEGNKTYNYIVGPVTTKSVVDNTYDVFFEFRMYPNGIEEKFLLGLRRVCYFLRDIYPLFLLPIGGTHNDFPPQESICPMEPGTTNIFPANSTEELVAPSRFQNGKYFVIVSFLKNYQPVGGIKGNFTVRRD